MILGSAGGFGVGAAAGVGAGVGAGVALLTGGLGGAGFGEGLPGVEPAAWRGVAKKGKEHSNTAKKAAGNRRIRIVFMQ